jgi:hypothetical protein
MQWYLDGVISEDEMISAIQFLVKEGINHFYLRPFFSNLVGKSVCQFFMKL